MKNNETEFDETNPENLLNLIKEQRKQIKTDTKKLEKLEEKYIKLNSDFKLVISDRTNFENFLKIIFTKEMHSNVFKSSYGLYETNELNKLWLICDNQKQIEFQKVVGKLKLEVNEYTERNASLQKELKIKINELINLKKEHETQNLIMESNMFNYNETAIKAENLEMEKVYLLQMVEEKNKEIEKLLVFEIENAELKAKSLLDSIEPKKEELQILKKPTQNSHSKSSMASEINTNPIKTVKISKLYN